ncbi:MAG TPA: sugar ABC transporter substrate-binding protein [Protaetiibacter sp.]|nr:sugar ABC transporter substrate-binding protein [Protaetiibacter sp.]
MSKSTRRWTALGAGLVAAAIAMTGCASGGGAPIPPATDDPESGELTFVYLGSSSQQETFEQLFEVFRAEYPDIELNAVGIPADDWSAFSTTVATRLAGGQPIDIIQVATEGQRTFASKDVLADLAPFIEQDKDFVEDYWSDISPRLREFNQKYASGPNGETIFIPGGYNVMGMYLNKDLFEQAGVPLPVNGNWTWDEFYESAKKIKEATGAYIIGADADYFRAVMPWLTTNGASTFNEDWTKATYNSPAAVEAVTFARKLIAEGLAPEPGGQFDIAAAYSQGQLAAVNGGRYIVPYVQALDMVDSTVYVNWPTNTTNGTPVGWDAWNITKKSEHKQAAWTFIKFLMSKQAAEYFAGIGGTIVPARLSVATSPLFSENAPEGQERLVESMEWATPIPSIDKGPQAQKIIQEAWLTVIAGQGDPKATLDAAQAELEQLLGG